MSKPTGYRIPKSQSAREASRSRAFPERLPASAAPPESPPPAESRPAPPTYLSRCSYPPTSDSPVREYPTTPEHPVREQSSLHPDRVAPEAPRATPDGSSAPPGKSSRLPSHHPPA